ncbi:hypothetical protein GQ457_06G017060 [Hibiscus cannabinus]
MNRHDKGLLYGQSLLTYNPIHKCYKSNKNTLISYKMIEKKIKDKILLDVKMEINVLLQTVWLLLIVLLLHGLIPILRESSLDLEHMMCAIHIYANWFKKWKGMNKKIQFKNCVRSSFVEDFALQIQCLDLGLTSSNNFFAILVQHWSKAYFKFISKCNVVDNNMAEAFNGWIVEARAKPIINMLKLIIIMVMSRMSVKKNLAEKNGEPISLRELLKIKVQPGRPKKKRTKAKDKPKKTKV